MAGTTFRKYFANTELGGKLKLLPDSMGRNVTAITITAASNSRLPSLEQAKQLKRKNDLKQDRNAHADPLSSPAYLNPLTFLRSYGWSDWVGGFGILPVINTVQIVLFEALEIFARTLGLIPITAGNFLANKIKNSTSTESQIGWGLLMIPLAPFWSLGQVLSVAADVFSNTRGLLDSGMRLINPLWWLTKAEITTDEKAPSFDIVGRTFVTSALKLLPAAIIIAAGVMTAGISVTVTHPLAGLLGTMASGGSTIAATVSALSAGAMAGYGILGTIAAGALAVSAKLFSGAINHKNIEHAIAREKDFENTVKQRVTSTPITAAKKQVSISGSTALVTDERHLKINLKNSTHSAEPDVVAAAAATPAVNSNPTSPTPSVAPPQGAAPSNKTTEKVQSYKTPSLS